MATQRIVALGQMWPNGDAKVIGSLIEFLGAEKPDQVIATAGATETFLRDLRGSYDGRVGAHLTSLDLCRNYNVVPLGDRFEFALGWATYSGPMRHWGHPDLWPLLLARKLQISIVTGATHRSSACFYTSELSPGSYAQVSGVGVGHLCARSQWPDGHVSATVLTACGENVERSSLNYRKGVLVSD